MTASQLPSRRLQGKVCIVTGGANGIGKASALRMAQEGATVMVADIDASGLEQTVAEICAAGDSAIGQRTDVTSAIEVSELIARAVGDYGRLDVLFNNAGGARPKPTHETSVADYREIIALNQDSVFHGIHAALPVMMKQRAGVILATTSGAGINAVEELLAYGAAKAAVIQLMKAVAVEYGPYGIRANAIAPGPMETAAFREWVNGLPGGAAGFARQVPLGRLGTPADIAATAAFLASDDAAFISGAVVPVDGAIAAKLASPRAG